MLLSIGRSIKTRLAVLPRNSKFIFQNGHCSTWLDRLISVYSEMQRAKSAPRLMRRDSGATSTSR